MEENTKSTADVYNDNSCPVPRGILVIIGGKEHKGTADDEQKKDAETNTEVLEAFLRQIPHKEPVLEVVTTASEEPASMYEDYRKAFGKLGVKKPGHIHHDSRSEALGEDVPERIRRADAIFFTGGDQLRLTAFYGGTPLLTALKDRYINDPIVIGGTSAGAMALSTPMICSGDKEEGQLAGDIGITTGLEFLKDVCIDTHFIDRSRFARMAQVIASNPTCIGIGIEENTAIILREGCRMTVTGTGLVTVVDGCAISETNITESGGEEERPFSVRDLKVHLLCRDDEYGIHFTNPPHK